MWFLNIIHNAPPGLSLGVLNVVSMLSIEGICVAALAPAVMTISGSIFQPLLAILSIDNL